MPSVTASNAPVEAALDLAQLRADVLSGRVVEIRKSARLSQTEVANAVGTVRSTVCSWEQRRRLPRGDLAARYAGVLAALAKQQEGRRGD